MRPVVLINGKKHSKISVFDRNMQFGDGLFETCLFQNQELLFWPEHFKRLQKGAEHLKINLAKESTLLKEIAKTIGLSQLKNGVVKILISRGESLRGYGFDSAIKSNRIVMVSPMPEISQEYTIGVCQSGYANNSLLAGIKHCNRLEQILARIDIKTDECLMLDENGFVISASQGNVFAIKKNTLITPDLSQCGIEGTRRQIILQLAKNLGLEVQIASLSLSQLMSAEEVFVTNSVVGIRPVGKINDQVFDNRHHTKQIQKAFSQLINDTKSRTKLKFKKHQKSWILTALMLIVAYGFWVKDVEVNQPTVYYLKPGSSLSQSTQDLEDLGYLRSARFAQYLAKTLGYDQLKTGYYDLHNGMSIYQLMSNFSKANVAKRNVTLIEGKTLHEYFTKLGSYEHITNDKTLIQIMQAIGVSAPYEGWLWPDTYQINYGDSLQSIFQRAHQTLKQKLDLAWQNKDPKNPLKSKEEALILASLIEKETAHSNEKPKIAGVFIHRLQKGMRLQTDPSVIYALGDQYKNRLTRKDLKIKSAYNTYRNKGLPPGAIGSVGADSLQAAMHPNITGDLYFVSKKDGTHAFAKTYQQHLHNINRYLKNL